MHPKVVEKNIQKTPNLNINVHTDAYYFSFIINATFHGHNNAAIKIDFRITGDSERTLICNGLMDNSFSDFNLLHLLTNAMFTLWPFHSFM